MRLTASNKQYMKLIKRVSLERTPVVVAMTSMCMCIQELELTFVERNLLSLKA